MSHPIHIALDDTTYFITARTYSRRKYFDTPVKKKIIIRQINRAKTKYGFLIYAWVILDNHYHFLIHIKKAGDLSKIMQIINGGSSFELNKAIKENFKIWDRYWDWIIESEEIFWDKFRYIITNPYKHGVIKSIADLPNYPFSSFNQNVKQYGKDFIFGLANESYREDGD